MTERNYLARHLRNLHMNMMADGHDICAELDPELKPTWVSTIVLLKDSHRLSVMQVAAQLDVSHVHAQKILKAMHERKFVMSTPDPDDKRRTFYSLTNRAQALIPKIHELNDVISEVLDDIEREIGVDLFSTLTAFKKSLDSKSWGARVIQKINNIEGK